MNKQLSLCIAALILCSSYAQAITYKVTDVNPSRFTTSYANSTNGIQQVGIANNHAFLWNGSANSYVDLSVFLPAGFTSSSATGIDNYGNVVGYATDSSGNNHAILWQVPEPATLLLFGLGAAIAARKQLAAIGSVSAGHNRT
jgi:probable HAF family extracellular repeat protein